MQLLAQGWGTEKVRARYVQHAERALADGVTFERMDHPHVNAVQSLISAHVLGMGGNWQISKDDGGLVALDAHGKVIGALLASLAAFQRPRPGYLVATVRAVAVDPAWRGHGVGVVLTGMAAGACAPHHPDFFMGSCAPSEARFYQKLGYTVLKPGESYPLHFGNYGSFKVVNPHYPCFFYREG